jgi:hypothetical protein
MHRAPVVAGQRVAQARGRRPLGRRLIDRPRSRGGRFDRRRHQGLAGRARRRPGRSACDVRLARAAAGAARASGSGGGRRSGRARQPRPPARPPAAGRQPRPAGAGAAPALVRPEPVRARMKPRCARRLVGGALAQRRRPTQDGQRTGARRSPAAPAAEPEAALRRRRGRGRRQHQVPAAPMKQLSAATALSRKRSRSARAAPCCG